MQFLVIGLDGTDQEALNRRLAARDAHLASCNKMKQAGQLLYGVAMLDDKQKMIGSVLVCNFESRQELDQWLKAEPYVTSRVWQTIEIKPCKVAPSFT